jgi:hypothetical protein
MLHLELPHINVLSKIDLIENYGNLGIWCFRSFCHLSIYCCSWNWMYTPSFIDQYSYVFTIVFIHLLDWQHSTLISTLMSKIFLICNIILSRILAQPSTGEFLNTNVTATASSTCTSICSKFELDKFYMNYYYVSNSLDQILKQMQCPLSSLCSLVRSGLATI